MDLTQKVDSVVLTKVCKVRADEDSTEIKTVTLRVDFSGCELRGVFDKAMSSEVIRMQGSWRKKFESLTDKQVVTIKFNAPAARQAMSFEELKAKIKAASTSEEKAYWKKQLSELLDELD